MKFETRVPFVKSNHRLYIELLKDVFQDGRAAILDLQKWVQLLNGWSKFNQIWWHGTFRYSSFDIFISDVRKNPRLRRPPSWNSKKGCNFWPSGRIFMNFETEVKFTQKILWSSCCWTEFRIFTNIHFINKTANINVINEWLTHEL